MRSHQIGPHKWAKKVLDEPAIILDTEMTGLGQNDVICQIAITEITGKVLVDELVKLPRGIRMTRSAESIHGISESKLKDGKDWGQSVWQKVYRRLSSASRVLVYNADFDFRMLIQTCKHHDMTMQADFLYEQYNKFNCVMLHYSQWCGEWNHYFGGYKWQKLPCGDHTALGDCRATLEVIRRMAS